MEIREIRLIRGRKRGAPGCFLAWGLHTLVPPTCRLYVFDFALLTIFDIRGNTLLLGGIGCFAPRLLPS